MRSLLTLVLILSMTTACSLSESSAPTSAPGLIGSVTINYPQDGTTVYAEMIYIQGTAEGLPNNTFTMEVVSVDDTIIARVTTTVTDGNWIVELPHQYTGEPVEVTIYAIPTDGDVATDASYDTAMIILAGNSYRPEGVFGSITSPVAGGAVGGESIQITGTASGLFENALTLGLYGADGAEISRTFITVMNPYFVDAALWSAELPTNGYVGAGELRASYTQASDGKEVVIATVPVTVAQEAG
jgi:hypothetical protein